MPYKRLLLELAVQKIICASPYIELSSKDYRILQVKSSPSAEFPSVLKTKKKKWKIGWGVPVSIRWQHEVEPLSRGWCEAELYRWKASIAVLPRVGEQSCSGTGAAVGLPCCGTGWMDTGLDAQCRTDRELQGCCVATAGGRRWSCLSQSWHPSLTRDINAATSLDHIQCDCKHPRTARRTRGHVFKLKVQHNPGSAWHCPQLHVALLGQSASPEPSPHAAQRFLHSSGPLKGSPLLHSGVWSKRRALPGLAENWFSSALVSAISSA